MGSAQFGHYLAPHLSMVKVSDGLIDKVRIFLPILPLVVTSPPLIVVEIDRHSPRGEQSVFYGWVIYWMLLATIYSLQKD